MCHLTGLQTIGVGDKATMKKKTAERQAPPPERPHQAEDPQNR